MKTFSSYIVLMIWMCNYGFTQGVIPNNGLEEWVSTGEFEEPTEWVTSNIFTVAFSDSVSVEKSTDRVEGMYSIHIKSRVYRDSFSSFSYGGFASCTKIQHLFGGGIPGFAYSNRPVKLKGFLKANSTKLDTSQLTVGLTKFNELEGKSEFIALGRLQLTDTIKEFIPFEIELEYMDSLSDVSPDTAVIFLNATSDSIINGGDLWVDDLKFELATQVKSIQKINFKVIRLDQGWQVHVDDHLSESLAYSVYSIAGQWMEQGRIDTSTNKSFYINTAKYAKGAYVLIIEGNQKKRAVKLIKG